jgi:predicted Zn-dependent protease
MLITRLKTILVVMIITVHATSAQSIGLLRDPDIEHGLQELADPILLSAGIKSNNIKILIVNDLSLNAFVIDNHHIFIHAGLVLKLTSAEQLQSVIAHEAAHIANGHIARRVANIKRAKVSSAFGVLLAVAAVAGGESKVGAGIALGTASSAQRVFLAHTRVEEASADQAALRYLSHAKVNPGSMSEVFKIFKGQMNLSLERQDPYTRSHPLNRDRIRAINAYTSAATILNKNQTHSYWFKRIQAKLSGFLRTPKWTLTHAKGDDEINLMRQAIANHRIGKGSLAKRKIDQLISLHPKDPYYKELQGQILLENNEYTAAIKAYAKAAQLAPVNAQILGSYGRSLLAVNTRSNNLTALKNLRKARELDNRDARILRDIAIAFARAGNEGQAVLAIAERYALLGDLKNATLQAAKAEGLLSRGSIAWQRAQDILDTVTGP